MRARKRVLGTVLLLTRRPLSMSFLQVEPVDHDEEARDRQTLRTKVGSLWPKGKPSRSRHGGNQGSFTYFKDPCVQVLKQARRAAHSTNTLVDPNTEVTHRPFLHEGQPTTVEQLQFSSCICENGGLIQRVLVFAPLFLPCHPSHQGWAAAVQRGL